METVDENSRLIPTDGNETCSKNDERQLNSEQECHQYNLSLPKTPILTSLWLGSFLSTLDGTIVANVMNRVAEEFGESSKKQWIATSFLLTNTAFQPLYGKLSDLTGRKTAILTAQFFFGLGCLLTSISQNVTQFAIARAICGIGAGGLNAMSSVTVSDICTARERGVYQGYANVVYGSSQLLGGPIGGLLFGIVGWRILFAIQVPMIALCSGLTVRFIKIKLSHVPPISERFKWNNISRIDLFGSMTLVLSITSIIIMVSSNLNKMFLGVMACISLFFFVYHERYWAKEKIIPFELMKGSFGMMSLVTLISSFVVYGDIFRSPIYLQVVQNFSVAETGLFLVLPAISLALGSVLTGYVMRFTKLNLEHCSFLIVLGSCLIQLLGLILAYIVINGVQPSLETNYSTIEIISGVLSSDKEWWKLFFLIASVLVAFGYSSLLVSTLVSIVFTIDKAQQGTMTGVFYLWRSIGGVLGESLTLVVYENSLSSKLWNYMFSKGNKGGYEFTKDQYRLLIDDSSYLRRFKFPKRTLIQILNVYKESFLVSYWPSILLTLIAIGGSFLLVWRTFIVGRALNGFENHS